MTDHRVREAERQYEADMEWSDRVEARKKEILPEVLANPNDHNIDVDLMDNADFADFLYATCAKPDIGVFDLQAAFHELSKKYRALAEKRALALAEDEIYKEDNDEWYEE